mmetsp:Transcript_23627/g.65280  ORF Transcript_23627/g.65280 Transcript_23627/m.65280 type:complete len:101 (-) Transcript_23627:373-675(-)
MQTIHAPQYIYYAWRVVRPFISTTMQERVNIVDNKRSASYTTALAALAPPESIPSVYGGECRTIPAAKTILPINARADDPCLVWKENELGAFLRDAIECD